MPGTNNSGGNGTSSSAATKGGASSATAKVNTKATGSAASTIQKTPQDAPQQDRYLQSWNNSKESAAFWRDIKSGTNHACDNTATKAPVKYKVEQPPITQPMSADCHFQSISAQCSHCEDAPSEDGLNYTVQKKRKKWLMKSGLQEATLEVVSKEGDSIQVRFDGLEALCGYHSDGIEVVESATGKRIASNIVSQGKFKAKAAEFVPGWSWAGLSCVRYLFPSSAPYIDYDIKATSCWDTAWLHVRSYPRIWWTADFSIGYTDKFTYGYGLAKTGNKYTQQFGAQSAKGGETLKAKLECEFGKTKYNVLEIEHERKKLEDTLTVLQMINTYITPVRKLPGLGKAVQVKFEYPTLHIKGSWGMKEHPWNGTTYVAYEIQVGMDPLIGVTFEIDVIRLLAERVPPIAWILDELDEGIKGDIVSGKLQLFAGLKVTGRISVFVTASGDTASLSELRIEPECAEASLTLTIEAYAKGELKVFIVKLSAGAGAGGTVEWKVLVRKAPKKPRSPSFEAKFLRGDLKVYAYAYADGTFTYESKPSSTTVTSDKEKNKAKVEYVLVDGNEKTAKWETFSLFN